MLTFIFMVVLIAFAGALVYMVIYETKDLGAQRDDYRLLNLAEAGTQRSMRAIRDDYLTTTQTGVADLRGADTTLSVSITNPNNMRYIDTSTAMINANTDQAILMTFDSNYTNTRIISVELQARARRAAGGTGATMQAAYTIDGSNYTIVITQALTTTLTDYSANITNAQTTNWSNLMSANFRLRVMRMAGTSNINLDSIYLRVRYGIDTLTEAWATGSYASFPITLGDGTIESISITDESGKIHLNYASQALLSNLMRERGIPAGTANTLAVNIVNYRGASLTNPFDSVEELQQVADMTTANYNLVKDFVTVYSFVNANVFTPAGPRAPVNINTASREVLEAIFDSLSLGAADPASLATDIMGARATAPFTCFFSSNPTVTTDFYDFVRSRAYLSTAGNPDEQDRVLDNSDASSLIPVSGSTNFNAVTTEFCYAASAFRVDSLAEVNDRRFRVKTVLGNNGSHTFATYLGDTASVGYRIENFEP